jgi:heme A synthase
MRATLSRHLDVVVVIRVLALAVAWSAVASSRASLRVDQWSYRNGQTWVIPSGDPGQ